MERIGAESWIEESSEHMLHREDAFAKQQNGRRSRFTWGPHCSAVQDSSQCYWGSQSAQHGKIVGLCDWGVKGLASHHDIFVWRWWVKAGMKW